MLPEMCGKARLKPKQLGAKVRGDVHGSLHGFVEPHLEDICEADTA